MARSAGEGLPHMERLMTLGEVAAYLRVSNDTVYRMANTGTIPTSKVGNQWRFRREDVDAWLEASKNVGDGRESNRGESRPNEPTRSGLF